MGRQRDPVDEPDIGGGNTTDFCHPLCQCEKCFQLRKVWQMFVYIIDSLPAIHVYTLYYVSTSHV